MEVLRFFALVFIVIAVVALEATVSNSFKVGAKQRQRKGKRKRKRGQTKVRDSVPKVRIRSSVIVRS